MRVDDYFTEPVRPEDSTEKFRHQPGYWTGPDGRVHLISILDHEDEGRTAHIEYFDDDLPVGQQRVRVRVPSTELRSVFEP